MKAFIQNSETKSVTNRNQKCLFKIFSSRDEPTIQIFFEIFPENKTLESQMLYSGERSHQLVIACRLDQTIVNDICMNFPNQLEKPQTNR